MDKENVVLRVHPIQYHSSLKKKKKKESLSLPTTWMNLGDIGLSEIRQRQTSK
jgi:hypothetical protein